MEIFYWYKRNHLEPDICEADSAIDVVNSTYPTVLERL